MLISTSKYQGQLFCRMSKDTYTLNFSDDSWEEITFDDDMKPIPKRWWQIETEQVTLTEYCCLLEARETACGLSKVNIPGTNFSESTDWISMLMVPDLEFWMWICKKYI
jgi:hypothetical protein